MVNLKTDILIIGGGTAGCYAGITAKEQNERKEVLIVEKGNIKRSGCLAGGIDSINAYLNPGQTPEKFLEYVKQDSEGLVREDLVYTIAQNLNKVVHKLEKWGVPFLKDDNGNYKTKGPRSIKINGERIKPIIAQKTKEAGVDILNRVVITNYIVDNNKVIGAFGFSVNEKKFYIIHSKAVICATGGASGIYKPNNPETIPHRMWYPPFNTGAGYAMGIRSGAEMTTFEMRFIALRTKDTIAPTGTLVQDFGAKQVNNNKKEYQRDYEKNSTPFRLYATNKENLLGNGPCFLDLTHLKAEIDYDLKKSYLNMAPSIVLKWVDQETIPSNDKIEIEGTEPYIVGGHAQAGYWINKKRETTLDGLYAAGDVAGGAPKKYASGCMVEGKIAAINALKHIKNVEFRSLNDEVIDQEINRVFKPLNKTNGIQINKLENRLQEIMDEYAGGISEDYKLIENKLIQARKLLKKLHTNVFKASVDSLHELMSYHEILDRVYVARVLVEHLIYRKETRWRGYQERVDYPNKDDDNWMKFVNSVYDYKNDEINMHTRNLIKVGELNDN